LYCLARYSKLRQYNTVDYFLPPAMYLLHSHGSIAATSFVKVTLLQKRTAPLIYTLRKSGSSAWHSSSVSWTNGVHIQARKSMSSGIVCSSSESLYENTQESLKSAHGRIPPHTSQSRIIQRNIISATESVMK